MIYHLFLQAMAAPLELSYEEALSRALNNNPNIQSAHIDVERAQGSLLEARGIFDPRLSTSFGRNYTTQQQFFAGLGAFESQIYGPSYTIGFQSYLPTGTNVSIDWNTSRNTSVFTSQEFEDIQQEISPIDTTLTMSITQSLLQGHRTQFNMQPIREAQRSLSISELLAIEARQEYLAQTASAYWNVLYQSKLVSLAQESLEIAKEEQRIVQAQVDQGNLASVEVDRVEAATLTAQSALIDAEGAYLASCEGLLLLLGEEPDQDLLLSTQPQSGLDVQYDLSTELKLAQEQNPTLARMRLSVQAAKERLREAQHAKLPELNATARYSFTGWEDELNESIEEMLQGGLPGRYIGLNLDVPIANWSDKGAVQQRVSDLEKAKQEYAAMERSITQQVQRQIRELKATQTKAKLAAVNLRVAEKTLAADRALRDAGRSIEKDVLASIKTVEDARVQYERALSDHQLARVELLKLQGAIR